MNRELLFKRMDEKQSCLCIGLDPDPDLIPEICGEGVAGMERFCLDIIAATHPYAIAYKPNLAFFEQYGSEGWSSLKRIISNVPDDCLVIADAKRGDIGNTALRYAKAIYEDLNADAITVAPYMGRDSVEPFIKGFEDRWTILLALTSNAGADDFEFHGNPPLFERVLEKAQSWGSPDELMFVVGATRPEFLKRSRELAPESFFLVPGVGAQGGDLSAVMRAGWTPRGRLIINSSRGIIYASKGADFAEAAKNAASKLQAEMSPFIIASAGES